MDLIKKSIKTLPFASLWVFLFVSPVFSGEPTVVAAPGEKGIIKFSDGSSFETTLYDPRYIGELKAEKKKPFLVLAGRGCDQCDAGISIYIHSPSDGPMKGEGRGQPRYPFPGKRKHYMTGEEVQEARAFLGACIPGGGEGIAWYVKWKDEKGKWLSGFSVAKIIHDAIDTQVLPQPEDKLKATLLLVKKGVCKELIGIDGYTEP